MNNYNQILMDTPSRKRKRNESKWRQNLIRDQIARGDKHEQHHRHNGEAVVVPERQRRDGNCYRCNPMCKTLFTEQEKDKIFRNYYATADRNVQTCLLRGETHCLSPENRTHNKKHQHYILLPTRAVPVCQKYFCDIYGLPGRSKLKKKVLNQNNSIMDGRGKYEHSPKVATDTKNVIRAFLRNYPARESHYSREDNPHRQYLDSSLSIAELHRRFLLMHPQYDKNTVKYSLFHQIFNYDFNIVFGYPRSDICQICESFFVQKKYLSHNQNNDPDVAEFAEIELQEKIRQQHKHWDDAAMFYKRMDEAKTFGPGHAAACFDFQKSHPLIITRIQQEYFKSKPSVFSFGIHDMTNNQGHIYMYTEYFAGKGSSEVISCLNEYLCGLEHDIKHVHLFCDSSAGQNKNRYMFSYLQYMVNTRFDEIFLHFPIPGHSVMAIDRDFGLLEKKWKVIEKIPSPSIYVKAAREAIFTHPFQVKYVNFPLTDDMNNDGTTVVNVLNYKGMDPLLKRTDGTIQHIKSIHFRKDTMPLVRHRMDDTIDIPFQLFRCNITPEQVQEKVNNLQPACNGFLPLGPDKHDNLQYLLARQYNPPNVTIFNNIPRGT